MPDSPVRILIVDGDPAVRTSMQRVLDELGYSARSAAEGFAALREIRQEMPDILLTDLNMPGMSGVELLVVVWRRFPAIQRIAMGAVNPGSVVPSGVAADALFQKGDGISGLLRIIETLPESGYRARQRLSLSAPLRIHIDTHASKACITIECPNCLRTFPEPVAGINGFMRESDCIHCGNPIQYEFVNTPRPARSRRMTRATLGVEQN